MWAGLTWLEYEQVPGRCEHGNGFGGFTISGNLFTSIETISFSRLILSLAVRQTVKHFVVSLTF
jgi:hypothetical protein